MAYIRISSFQQYDEGMEYGNFYIIPTEISMTKSYNPVYDRVNNQVMDTTKNYLSQKS